MKTMRCSMLLVPLAAACLMDALWAAEPEKPAETAMPRTYFIGNSLTDHFTAGKRPYNPNGPAIERVCAEAGLPVWPYAGKNIAGAPLWWHWYHINDGLRGVRDPQALAKAEWDIVTFQPHGGTRLHAAGSRDETTNGKVLIKAGEPRGDVEMIANFLQIMLKNPANHDARVYVYSTWCSYPKGKRAAEPGPDGLDFSKRWLARNDEPRMFTRQYFEALQDELNALCAPGKALEKLQQRILMLPAGDVFLALDAKIKSGALPDIDPRTPKEIGVSDAWVNIGDNPAETAKRSIHVNPLGQTILSYIFFSTLLQRDCHGLDMRSLMNKPTKTEFSLSDEQVKIIQDTVWEVIRNHPRAGLKKPPTSQDVPPVAAP
jgi:hypothetical protein